MEVLGKIRRLYYRDGLSFSEIARKTGYTRNTVKRWLKVPEGVKPRYQRQSGDTKIAAYAAHLVKALEVDAHRPKRDRRTALKLFGEIQAVGFTGDYSRVTEFVRRWWMQGGQAKVNAYIPLKFELGEAFQFDWSEEHLVIGGVWRKILAAHLKLCASRAFVVSAYPTQGHEMLFDAHTRAFSALGGDFLPSPRHPVQAQFLEFGGDITHGSPRAGCHIAGCRRSAPRPPGGSSRWFPLRGCV